MQHTAAQALCSALNRSTVQRSCQCRLAAGCLQRLCDATCVLLPV